MKNVLLLFSFLHLSLIAQQAPLGKSLGTVSQVRGATASDGQITSALTSVLSTAVPVAVRLTGAENGFWGNDSIRIALPDAMQSLDNGLRMMGDGLKIQEFQLSMNRAAEASAKEAGPVLDNAIKELKFSDSRGTLNGNDSAAADLLRQTKAADLTRALKPIVEAAMSQAAVTQRYGYLSTKMQSLTMGHAPTIDITSYVIAKTIDGLVSILAREEARVRTDPQAHDTPLLKQVFGKS